MRQHEIYGLTMERIPEEELMVDEYQARAYAEADFAEAHQAYVGLFAERFPEAPAAALALDIGCGPGDVTRRFARAFPGWTIHGMDGSPAMLAEFRRFLADEPALAARLTLVQGILPGAELPVSCYEIVLCSSLLHQLHEPQALWETIRRYAEPGAPVFVTDLARPATPEDAAALVALKAATEPEQLQRDFYNSLLAAFTPDEVRAQLTVAGLDSLRVEAVGDHHLMIWGRMPV